MASHGGRGQFVINDIVECLCSCPLECFKWFVWFLVEPTVKSNGLFLSEVAIVVFTTSPPGRMCREKVKQNY